MQCRKAILHVRPDTERSRRADQNANLAAAHLVKELLLVPVRNFLHDSDLLAWDPRCDELVAHVVVDIKSALPGTRGGRFVAEEDLRPALLVCRTICVEQILHAAVHLAVRSVRRICIHETRIEGERTPRVRNQEHTVICRCPIDALNAQRTSAANVFCTPHQIVDDRLLFR